MNEEKTLKQFLEDASKETPFMIVKTSGLINKLLELDSIEQYLNTMLGIELKITAKPVKRREGRNYGIGLVEKMVKEK